jgi:hypothetical protein
MDVLLQYVSYKLLTFLSIPTHKSLEISVCPLCNLPFHVLSYLIYSILIPDHYLYSLPISMFIAFLLPGIVLYI